MKMLSNASPPKHSRELWKHFSDTYFSLRVGLAVLAFALPFVLYLWGKWVHGLDLQPSMSAYFWAAARDQCATFPMRTIFVGFLFAIAAGLYLYKGLTNFENTLLNLAALCAAVVAIVPERLTLTEAAGDPRISQLFDSCPAVKAWAALPSVPVHYAAAVLLFVLLGLVAWACANKSLEYLPPEHDARKFRLAYKIIAIGMIACPVAGLLIAFVVGIGSYKVFIVEAAGVLTFATYWAVKSYELRLSGLERDPDEAIQHAQRRGGGGQGPAMTD